MVGFAPQRALRWFVVLVARVTGVAGVAGVARVAGAAGAARRALAAAALRALALACLLGLGTLVHAQCDDRVSCCGRPPRGGTPVCGQGGPAQQAPAAPTAPSGNPLDVMSGNKYQREVDLPALPGVLGLELVRHYNSALSHRGNAFGRGWRLSYEATLRVGEHALTIVQGDGATLTFTRGFIEPDRFGSTDPLRGSVVREHTPRHKPLYVWRWPDGQALHFDQGGKLTSINAPTGEAMAFIHAPDGKLVRVRDPQGRELGLHYDKLGRIDAISSPVGRFTYAYEGRSARLAKVTLPGEPSVRRRYHYEDERHPELLTGISVESAGADGQPASQRLATWGYDERGWAVSSVKGDGKDNVERVSVQRKALPGGAGEAVLTNSLGHTTTYRWRVIAGQQRLLEVVGPGCATCGETNVRYAYDKLARLIETTKLDERGQPMHALRHTLDPVGRVMRSERVDYRHGKAQPPRLLARFAYALPPASNPILIARPSVVAGKEHVLRIAYNEAGQATQVTEEGFSPVDEQGQPAPAGMPISRTTTYAYSDIRGRSVLTLIDGPLPNGPQGTPEDSDITRYTWNASGTRVVSIAHPAGLASSFEYDDTGRMHRHTGVDGVVTMLGYAPQGQPKRLVRAGAVTSYRYDALGTLAGLTTSIGQALALSHDAGLRLSAFQDPQSNRIDFQYDSEGRLLRARLHDPQGMAAQVSNADQSLDLDLAAALTRQRDAFGNARSNFARPELLDAPYRMLTDFVAHGLVPAERSAEQQVLDSQGRATTTWRDDFGRIVLVRSPVTAGTRYEHDATGQVVRRYQADGSRAIYVRDAAGRVVAFKAVAPDGTVDEDATITWGKANKPTRVRYAAGEEQFAYDDAARLVEHVQSLDGKRWVQRYRYDAEGRRIEHTLPGGQTLAYRYRGAIHPRAGLLASVWLHGADNRAMQGLTAGLMDRPVVQGLNDEHERYTRRDFAFGNGLMHSTELDADGRISAAGNPQVGRVQLSYVEETPSATTMRLVEAGQHAQAQIEPTLLVRLHGAAARWREVPAPRPIASLAAKATAQGFDRLGRQTTYGDQPLRHDSLNRLVEVRTAAGEPVARYRYNLFGQRIAKMVYGTGNEPKITYYLHDGSHLAAEADAGGDVQRQYVWLNDKPVAALQGGAVLAIHTDHRNAPLAVTDESRRVLWQADVADFGHAASPVGSIEFNLRLSNQYYDAETGLHYNTHRYYDPQARRYVSPDPMGLVAGPDLYAFALDRPHELADPLGLQPRPIVNGRLVGWTYDDKLAEIVRRSAPLLPGEIGSALLDLVQPQNLAVMGAVFAVWAGSQFTPLGWVADLALLGTGIWYAGTGIVDLYHVFVALHRASQGAQCESHLNTAARQLSRGFVTASGELAGGLSGTWGLMRTGALSRIADGIRTVANFGRRQTGARGVPPIVAAYARPDTSRAVYGPEARYRRSDGEWDWPPNNGFDGAHAPGALPPGTLADRFGRENGSFLAPLGTPFEMRSLPPSGRADPYFAYRVERRLPVESGRTAPRFDQPGGGTQYFIDWAAIARAEGTTVGAINAYPGGKIAWLVDMGYLARLVAPGGLRQ